MVPPSVTEIGRSVTPIGTRASRKLTLLTYPLGGNYPLIARRAQGKPGVGFCRHPTSSAGPAPRCCHRWYTGGMGGTPRKPAKPRPSYEDGHLRDPDIEAKQDEGFSRKDLDKLLRRAAAGNQTRR